MSAPSRFSGSGNLFEIALSGAVIALALGFLVFMKAETGTGRLTSYGLTVEMANAGGLKIGTDVRIAGVKIGSITGLSINSNNYLAEVRVALRDDLLLPADSAFQVNIPAMSDPFLSVSPGRSTATIIPGSILRRPAAKSPPSKSSSPRAGV